MDDLQFLDIFRGKLIKLTLKTSSYVGVVQRINSNKTVLLADVVYVEKGIKVPGLKLFFGHEIVNVEFPGKTNSGDRETLGYKLEDHLLVEEFQPYRKSIRLDDDEDDEVVINFEVIDEFHGKFGSAVMHIKKQRLIGVGADAVEAFQQGRLCWLQIATKNKVYLFDILVLGAQAFKNGLSMILENKHILKVIHDCRVISACLLAQFGVRLTNVFDTQVADVMCFYSETGGFLPDRVSTLQEVVSLHLNVPSSQLSSLKMKSQLTKEERELWYKRPCPLPLLKVMALSVIHLLPLRLVLLDTLMTDYMDLVDSYLSSSYNEPGEVEHINMDSVLALPRELRELERMRRERREWATNRYPLTEQDLLVRFKPRPQSSHQTQTSPPAEEPSQDPATVEAPSPAQVDFFYDQQSTKPSSVTDISSAQSTAINSDLIPALSDLRKQQPVHRLVSPAAGRGLMGVRMETMGGGRPLGKEQQSSFLASPPVGRGFSVQIPPTQLLKESPGRMETAPTLSSSSAQNVMPQLTHNTNSLSGSTLGLGRGYFNSEAKSLSSPLSQSFSSFRKT
ncbi:piRNA biogenesis protein EXD1 isoform X2 [Myripristis murdjan]|uniref:Delta like canonical Notch ligand 4 n=1 Tax=Myripristis murdjan TaxID=586833 RepID=A0A667Y8D0_9TELE|nr:piRNA biogenesis protein EXD1 isoform X2 [Myripristis murdjan]